jgi:hypothetical protein
MICILVTLAIIGKSLIWCKGYSSKDCSASLGLPNYYLMAANLIAILQAISREAFVENKI